MIRTRIKFCGMTRIEDAVLASRLGVDAVGFVFTRRSARYVDPTRARAIASALPPWVDVVALFMDAEADWVREVEHIVQPHWLQFHGSEDDAFCADFATPHVKAIAMAGAQDDLAARGHAHPHARAFLLDGHAPGEQGGQGQPFDWSRVSSGVDRPLILAGGLDAGNVASAIARVRPWAVDVSSGIESAPGVKDAAAMAAFVAAVRDADAVRA